MKREIIGVVVLLICFTLVGFSHGLARAIYTGDPDQPPPATTAGTPAYCIASHDIGKINLAVNNNGTFGSGYSASGSQDCFTGETIRSCEYPKGSNTVYLFTGVLWIGAVSGRDTLVSTGADGWSTSANEFHPEEAPLGNMIYRSTIDPAKPEFDGAISEQDYIAVYYDTCLNCPGVTNDELDGRPHRPLNLEVTQRSFAWSYAYAEDIVLFDYAIRNIGNERLRRVFMGIYVDADIYPLSVDGSDGAQDDIAGFHQKLPADYLPEYCPPDSDVVNIAWTADNDGGLSGPVTETATPNITATRIVRTPSDSLEVSFNWWISNGTPSLDFGPQTRAGQRDFGTGGLGTPTGDRNKYFIMSNGEFDYDQVEVASIDPLDPVWLPPPANRVDDWATGLDTRYLLSFGPFDIEPGQTLPISLAYVAGENFHTDPNNINNLPNNWQAYYEGVDFSDLGANATWADWIYDNPGVDTDNDSFFGEYTVCNLGTETEFERVDTIVDTSITPPDTIFDTLWLKADTIWRKGDGVPDFQGASPPPAPSTYTTAMQVSGLRVEPGVGKIKLRWNGVLAENARDVFSREYDFEGYRVYIGRDDRRLSYTLVTSYDKEDYNKYVWDNSLNVFKLYDSPYTKPTLRSLYGGGDPDWDPLDYSRTSPYVMPSFPDSIFYFEGQDYNQYILANYTDSANTLIRKVYPNAPMPPTIFVDSIADSLHDLYLTDEDFFKYFEYEVTIDNLLPTVPYWLNVTAFDYGSPRSGLAALETNPTLQPIVTYPLESSATVAAEDREVFVYPNPYRMDANYRGRGFEGRSESDRPNDRVRAVHFANLPPKCTIRIYTLDGDLVREINHDFDPVDPLANHDTWNLITRNTQLVVSGLYYWTVEDDQGNTQIGKLAIIL